jgi:hypothetical protein
VKRSKAWDAPNLLGVAWIGLLMPNDNEHRRYLFELIPTMNGFWDEAYQ